LANKKEPTGTVADRFLATDEAEEWQAFTRAANAALEKSDSETVTVPAAFLRRVLPEISADPLMFRHLLDAWNRTADELGLPKEKK
jgi:hypothetical protein